MRNLFYLALASFSLGMTVCANVFPKKIIALALIAYTFFIVFKVLKQKKYLYSAGILFLCTGIAAYFGIFAVKTAKVKAYYGTKCDLYATVTGSESAGADSDNLKYYAYLTKINSEKAKIKFRFYAPANLNLKYGDRIVIKNACPYAVLSKNKSGYSDYLKAKGIFMTVNTTGAEIQKLSEGKGILRSISDFRKDISKKTEKYLDKDCAGIVNAVTTGDKSNLQKRIKILFSVSGISHLLAVSGLHLTLFVTYFSQIIRKKDYITQRYVKPLFAIFTALFVMALTGFGYSVIRAGIMLIILNISKMLGREKDSVNSLMIAAAVIIVLNPYSVFDLGFELSFFATLGILIYAERIKRFLIRFLRFETLSSTVATTLSAQIFTTPILVFYFKNVSFYSVLANIITIPVFTVLLFTSALFVVCAYTFPAIINVFTGNIYIATKIIMLTARIISRLPYAAIPVSGAEFALTVIFAAAMRIVIKNFKTTKYRKSGAIILTVCAIGIFYANYDGRDLKVTFLDVGQGSCSHIKTPGGENIMIDCGVSKYYSKYDIGDTVYSDYLSPNGITHLDYAILTHYHDDHFSGLLTLMEDGMVDTLILPKPQNVRDREDYENIRATALLNDVDIEYFSRSSDLSFGDVKFTVISPGKGENISQNDESLVIKLTYKGRGFLFTGDIENSIMRTLKKSELTADVIQSPHHGLKTSNLDSFYKNTEADYAVISAGKDNSYKHPHPEHINTLAANNIKILRTDQNGNICFTVDKNGNVKYKVEEAA